MTTSRLLPIANLIGCLLITGIIVAQWLKERGLDETIDGLNKQLVATNERYDGEKIRATALEGDVAQLKESIESTVKARKETEDAMAKMIAEREAQAATAAATAANAVASTHQTIQEQGKAWEEAIADRDAKIRELNSSLSNTRTRLDEAIEKLKQAGAR